MFTSFNLVKNFFITVEYDIKIQLFWAGFLKWVYPKNPPGFLGTCPAVRTLVKIDVHKLSFFLHILKCTRTLIAINCHVFKENQ